MENLRKVNFRLLTDPNLGLFDHSDDEDEEREFNDQTKNRNGLFHCWGNEPVKIDGQNFQQTFAIIEEVGNGIIFKIKPENVIFEI